MEALTFLIDKKQFAIDLSIVERVIRIIEVTLQPNAGEHVEGIINLHGHVVPVINFRTLIGLEKKEIDLGDQLIICTVFGQKVALWIDKVKQITTPSKEELSHAIDSLSKDDAVEWVIKEGKEVALFYNVGKLLKAKTLLFSKEHASRP